MFAANDELPRITIPREVFWICLAAPWLTAPLFEADLFALSLREVLRDVAGSYLPFLGIPLLLWLIYRYLVPVRAGGAERPWLRYLLHWAIATATGTFAAVLLRAPHAWLEGRSSSWLQCISINVVVTWIFMLPTVILQEQRARTERAQQLAQAARQAALEAQLEALMARTNPHFLFNGINTVASLIPDDPTRAEETLVRLADILRYTLEGARMRLVPLSRELAVVRDYLEVQAVRFGPRLRFEIEVQPEAASLAVPPLCLQTLVENAVLHGLAERRGGGEVQVRVRRVHDCAQIEVLDDGVGLGGSQHRGSGTGLSDLARRLTLLFGDLGRLESGPRAQGGFRVCLTLPFEQPA